MNDKKTEIQNNSSEKSKEEKNEKTFEEKVKKTAEQIGETVEETANEIEKSVKNTAKEIEHTYEGSLKREVSRIGELIAIGINIVFLWIAYNITSWDYEFLNFIKDDFHNILWAITITTGVSIFVNLVRFITADKRIIHTTRILENISSIFLLSILLTRFPFDFRELISVPWINNAAKTLIIFIMIAVAIATIVEIVKLITSLSISRNDENDK